MMNGPKNIRFPFSLIDIQLSYFRFPASVLFNINTELSQLPLVPRTWLIKFNRQYVELY